jgi:hypothetical protein
MVPRRDALASEAQITVRNENDNTIAIIFMHNPPTLLNPSDAILSQQSLSESELGQF